MKIKMKIEKNKNPRKIEFIFFKLTKESNENGKTKLKKNLKFKKSYE